jgi:hypothetical protein
VPLLTLDAAAAGTRPLAPIIKAVSGTLVVGRVFSYWATAGVPGPGSYNGTLNGVNLSSTAGQVPGQIFHVNPVSGDTELLRLAASMSQPGLLLLCDRLWHNGGLNVTLTTAQAITQPTLENRCPTSANDTAPSTNGHSVLLALEVSAVTGAGTPVYTINYTNSNNVAGRTATLISATSATSPAGTTYLFGLQAGDNGVRSVQSVTASATWTSGTVNLVAYRIIATMEINPAGGGNIGVIDWVTSGAQRMYDGVVPYFMFIPSATTSTGIVGSLVETQG